MSINFQCGTFIVLLSVNCSTVFHLQLCTKLKIYSVKFGVAELPPFWERVTSSACHLFFFMAVYLHFSIFPFDAVCIGS